MHNFIQRFIIQYVSTNEIFFVVIVFLQRTYAARDNATHKYFTASHMLGTMQESTHKAESMMAKKRRNENGYCFTILRKKFNL